MLVVVVELQGILEETGTPLQLSQLLMPYAAQLRRERLSPKRLRRSATRRAHRWEHLLDVLPDDLARLLEASSRSELKVPLVVEGLDRPVNRLAYALVTAATIQGSSQLLARRHGPDLPGNLRPRSGRYRRRDIPRRPGPAQYPSRGWRLTSVGP